MFIQHAEMQMKPMQNKLLLKKHTSGEIIVLHYIGKLYRLFIRSYTFSKEQTYLSWNI